MRHEYKPRSAPPWPGHLQQIALFFRVFRRLCSVHLHVATYIVCSRFETPTLKLSTAMTWPIVRDCSHGKAHSQDHCHHQQTFWACFYVLVMICYRMSWQMRKTNCPDYEKRPCWTLHICFCWKCNFGSLGMGGWGLILYARQKYLCKNLNLSKQASWKIYVIFLYALYYFMHNNTYMIKNLCSANLCNLHLTCIIRISKFHTEICPFMVPTKNRDLKVGTTKSYTSKRCIQLEAKKFAKWSEAPKLVRYLSAAIRTVLEVLQEHYCSIVISTSYHNQVMCKG